MLESEKPLLFCHLLLFYFYWKATKLFDFFLLQFSHLKMGFSSSNMT